MKLREKKNTFEKNENMTFLLKVYLKKDYWRG